MHMNLSLGDVSCLLALPNNFDQYPVSISKHHFYQKPRDLGHFLHNVLYRKSGVTELIHILSNRYWHKYKKRFFQQGISDVQELPGRLITLLLQRLESTVRKPAKGLTCPQQWFQYSYNWGGFLYVVFNNLLKGFLDLRSTSLELYSDQILPPSVSVTPDPISNRETIAQRQHLPILFVQMSEVLYNSNILSPQRHLLFGCFHAPQALSPTILQTLLHAFEHAQPAANTLFLNSRYRSLNDAEPKRFAKRASFLAWLLYGQGFDSIVDLELHAPAWNKQAKSAIHRAKNHSKTIVFRYLMIALYSTSGPLGFEVLWRDLKKWIVRYLDSAETPNLQKRLHLWNNTPLCSEQQRLQDLYTITFTKHASFKDWNLLHPRQANRSFQHFHPLYYQILTVLQKKQFCTQSDTVEQFPY